MQIELQFSIVDMGKIFWFEGRNLFAKNDKSYSIMESFESGS